MRGVDLETLTVASGNDMTILGALEKAEREDSWVLVQNIHLMSDKLLKEIRYILNRVAKHRGTDTHAVTRVMWPFIVPYV